MNLKILINGREAALPAGVEISMKFHNHFFNLDTEDATYPLTLDVGANRHIFGFPERFNSRNIRTEYPASVILGPYRLMEGRCIVTDINNDEIEIYITTDRHSFWGKSNTAKLSALDLGREQFASVGDMMDAFTRSLTIRGDYVVCPLYDPYTAIAYPNLYKPFYNFFQTLYDNPATPDLPRVFKPVLHGKHCIFTPFIRLKTLVAKAVNALGYRIVRNDLFLDRESDDIIVICRRNPLLPAVNGETSFEYRNSAPDITASELFLEIERKFGYRFIADESTKTLSILAGHDSATSAFPRPLDTFQKHIIQPDDRKTGFIFKDKSSPDTYAAKYYDNGSLQYTYGDPEGAGQTECTSTITGTATGSEAVAYGIVTYTLHFDTAAVAASYEKREEYDSAVRSEFRLAVYRGIVRNPDTEKTQYADYPLANVLPLSYAANKLSLLWQGADGLFARYHSAKCHLLSQLEEEHELTLETRTTDLYDLNRFFTGTVIARNLRYYCYEQEISIADTGIVSHTLRCYPDDLSTQG